MVVGLTFIFVNYVKKFLKILINSFLKNGIYKFLSEALINSQIIIIIIKFFSNDNYDHYLIGTKIVITNLRQNWWNDYVLELNLNNEKCLQKVNFLKLKISTAWRSFNSEKQCTLYLYEKFEFTKLWPFLVVKTTIETGGNRKSRSNLIILGRARNYRK